MPSTACWDSGLGTRAHMKVSSSLETKIPFMSLGQSNHCCGTFQGFLWAWGPGCPLRHGFCTLQ